MFFICLQDGKTALDLAKEENHLQILEYLSQSPVNKHVSFIIH